MKWAIGVALAGIGLLLMADPPSKPKQPSSVAAKPTSQSGSGARKRRVKRAAASNYQSHPDPERYQQIQQALADRGYFKGQVDGHWSDDSVDALKRFQADQKLDSDGKINSLTLIGLGLGPKHDAGALSSVATGAAATEASSPPH